MSRQSFALLTVFLLAGCGHGSADQAAVTPPAKASTEAPTADADTPKDPVEKLREQLRSAAVQLNPAVDKIQEAYEAAKELEKSPFANKEVRQALEDVVSSLTDAGSTLSNFTEEPPELDAFKKDLPKFQKQRDALIIGCNDAIHDLTDAEATLDDISSSASPKLQNPIEGVSGSIDEALGTVRDALTGAGGKEEKLDDVPDSPDAPAPK